MSPELTNLWISFAWTTGAFLDGTKTHTRRYWKTSHAAKFRAGMVVRALDKDYRANGKQIGWALLTKDPYLQPLAEMTQEDFIKEGGTRYWEALEYYQWMMKREGQDPYVIEFVRCNEQGEPIMSSDEERELSLKDETLKVMKERVCANLDECWNEIWDDKDTAAKMYAEDGGKEHQFKYNVSIRGQIHPKGSGNIEVPVRIKWSVAKTCELPAGKVSDGRQKEMDLDGKPVGEAEAAAADAAETAAEEEA